MSVRRWLPGFAMLVLLGVATALAATVATAMPQGETTFSDPVGDSKGGPDVTKVTISGDAATGTITVAVTTPGYLPASPDGLERNVIVWFDTDNKGTTGDPEDGTEYAVSAQNDSTGQSWGWRAGTAPSGPPYRSPR